MPQPEEVSTAYGCLINSIGPQITCNYPVSSCEVQLRWMLLSNSQSKGLVSAESIKRTISWPQQRYITRIQVLQVHLLLARIVIRYLLLALGPKRLDFGVKGPESAFSDPF